MKTLMNFLSMVLVIGVLFYQAMVFMFFFNWFVATTFGLHVIGYWVSFALILTVSTLRIKTVHKSLLHYEKTKMKDEDKWAYNIVNPIGVFIALNIALFIGWLIQLNIN